MVSSAHDLRSLAVETVRLIDEGLVKRITGLTAVHAGVVELGGRALLLPGSTKSGKSSLVAELLRHGAVYFSDEYALIDAQGRAHPYPSSIDDPQCRPGPVSLVAGGMECSRGSGAGAGGMDSRLEI